MDCPYCTDRLVRHIQHHELYWFCRSCWERVPILSNELIPLSTKLPLEREVARYEQRIRPDKVPRPLKERVAIVEEVARPIAQSAWA